MSAIHPKRKILVTGSRGNLGRLLCEHNGVSGIDRDTLDITDEVAVVRYFKRERFDIIIHCAAFTDVSGAEKNRDACYTVNVIGTENLVKHFKGKKFVYISTDYIFDGARGSYRENDTPNPVNYYALTKLLGEMVIRQYQRTLIVRTSFKPDGPWPHPKAFVDQWTSADYASERAPQILQAALHPTLFGIVHIGGARKSIYELAKKQTPGVGQMSIADIPTHLPRDVSLDSSYWESVKKAQS